MPSDPHPSGLEPLEVVGALNSRFVHDMANHLTCLVANLQILSQSLDDPASVSELAAAASESANLLGELLKAQSRIRKAYHYCPETVDVAELGSTAAAIAEREGRWMVRRDGLAAGSVAVNRRWFEFIVGRFASVGAEAGQLLLETGGNPMSRSAGPGGRRYFVLTFNTGLSLRGDKLRVETLDHLSPDFARMIAADLVTVMGGFIQYPDLPASDGSTRAAIRVALPLLEPVA